ncbi:MAG: glycosyltransferase [Betaproteobacteria bacterium]|nr:glycosyltransferase [Betaproteobacteria bacterium]
MSTRFKSDALSFFTCEHHPYYIFAPDFQQSSAGIRCLHYLCHTLNEKGLEAYIHSATTVSPYLHTHRLTREIVRRHFVSGRRPIAVYPEIISGNPLHAPTVARWLLNRPGHLGGDAHFDVGELLFCYDQWTLPAGMVADMLRMPSIDTRIFNNIDNPFETTRHGFCYYAHKYLVFGGKIREDLVRNGISLCHDIPRSHEEIADILRKSETLYCHEQSAIIAEALACGCPVIIVTSTYWETTKWPHRPLGVRFDTDGLDLHQAKAELSEYPHHIEAEERRVCNELDVFINKTQAAALAVEAENPPGDNLWLTPPSHRLSALSRLDMLYADDFEAADQPEQLLYKGKLLDASSSTDARIASQKWLNNRQIFDTDVNNLTNSVAKWSQPAPRFHLLIRVAEQQSNDLADTLDSLVRQAYGHWHLDILSPMATPPGLDELPCINWHVFSTAQESKSLADQLVTARLLDLVAELPAGAMLDPLCLWRLADESMRHPKIGAFFADDYTFDQHGICEQIRFKPGVNPEWLQSSDLAGPIWLRREIWLGTGGASQQGGSPWFSQLLRVSEKLGWHSILHIPDVLVSYLDTFPSDTNACLLGVLDHLKAKETAGEIVPVTGQSWCIRYPLETPPPVSIAIISRGQLDLLSRCLNSIVEKTNFPNYEVICVLPDECDDRDLNAWLANIQQSETPTVRVIRTENTTNYAARCNAAVKASSNALVLLIREEAVIIQEKWLEELVRTGLQPDIAAVAPCLIAPGTSKIQEAGSVIGLQGLVGSPYQGEAKLGESGYLDSLRIARDVSALSGSCLLVRSAAYLAAGGMDEAALGDYYADTDLCQKLRNPTQRLIYQPLATVVCGGETSLDIESGAETEADRALTKAHAANAFSQRWLTHAAIDPFWNPNLSLAERKPTPETDYHAQWQYLPSAAPRVLARNFWKGESFFRIDSALALSRKAGVATECCWPQDKREPSAAELLRLAPDTVIVHQYLKNPQLAALQDWRTSPDCPFVVYTIDDLMTDMAKSNSLRTNIPANSRTRLKYALERSDRLVTSTEFLAESYRHFISDIRVVPNRLVGETWLPLQSLKRTTKKPRIGWAGGRTHLDDLMLLKEVIEQTRGEADWVFFGMCPDDMLPLVAEYHPYTTLNDYPSRLAALNLDLAVAPLAQTAFNQAKSNLRLLEYGVLGIPVVCTDIDPYRGSPACRVANTTGAWTKALRDRIHDAKAREREGVALRQWVHQGYLLENFLEEWLAAHLPSAQNKD